MVYDVIVSSTKVGTTGSVYYKTKIFVDSITYLRILNKSNRLDAENDFGHFLLDIDYVSDHFSDQYSFVVSSYFDISPFKDNSELAQIFTTSGYFVLFHNTPGCETLINLKKEIEELP